ncbi:hypothetical protein QYE76_019338 [Lolium multiflorum]|uniref:Uncharacterized protein n=1 Tax=Lolium multiflorum TaxID=4521 RepID=A0AAD8VQC0_LOLMU|nr:hypothetical protein QYE76_019338 [Lolium multiflorum]
MEPTNTKFYQLGNDGELIFENDLNALSDFLGRPHPEFHGVEVNDQPEELGVITADPGARWSLPTRGSSFLSGKQLAGRTPRALGTCPIWTTPAPTPTRLTLHWQIMLMQSSAKDRKTLRLQRAKKNATITRLRARIASLEATVKAQEDQLNEMEEDGEDLQEGEAFLSDDDDFEADENTEEEDYEFLEAGEDDFIPIDVDDE